MSKSLRCKNCEKYVPKDDMFFIGLSSFCSYDCYNQQIYKRSKTIKKTTVRSVGRENFASVCQINYDKVLFRDKCCRLCGGTSNLVVHHIYYKSEARYFKWCSQPHNLITLCNEPCHLGIVHGGKKRFQPLCLALVWLTYQNNSTINLYQLEERINNGS